MARASIKNRVCKKQNTTDRLASSVRGSWHYPVLLMTSEGFGRKSVYRMGGWSSVLGSRRLIHVVSAFRYSSRGSKAQLSTAVSGVSSRNAFSRTRGFSSLDAKGCHGRQRVLSPHVRVSDKTGVDIGGRGHYARSARNPAVVDDLEEKRRFGRCN